MPESGDSENEATSDSPATMGAPVGNTNSVPMDMTSQQQIIITANGTVDNSSKPNLLYLSIHIQKTKNHICTTMRSKILRQTTLKKEKKDIC